MVKKYGELYLNARKALRPSQGDNASVYARELLSLASGKSVAALLADRELYASEEIEEKLNGFLARILAGEPLAYILGEWSFYGLPFLVTPDVLIPRDDTMAVTDLAIEVTAFSVDVLQPAPRFLGQFDLIVSNPPYVTTQEMAKLDVSVWAYEPHLALEGGADGLDFYRAILRNFDAALRPGGTICFEFGFGQETALTELLQAAGYEDVTLRKDLRGVVRAVSAKKPEV